MTAVDELLQLYRAGVIDAVALNAALRSLPPPPPNPPPLPPRPSRAAVAEAAAALGRAPNPDEPGRFAAAARPKPPPIPPKPTRAVATEAALATPAALAAPDRAQRRRSKKARQRARRQAAAKVAKPPAAEVVQVAKAAVPAPTLSDEEVRTLFIQAGLLDDEEALALDESARYYAEFTLKFNDKLAADGAAIPGRKYYIKAWADLTPEQVRTYSAVVGESQDPSLGIAVEWSRVFGFKTALENFMSQLQGVTMDALEPDAGAAAGAFDVAGVPLTNGGAVQPHLAGAVADYVKGGRTISSRFYRDGSCLVSAIFEATFDGVHDRRAKIHPLYESHESMYLWLTGRRVGAGKPMPLSLRQAERAFSKFGIKVIAVDHAGRVVYRHNPDTQQRRHKVLRLVIKNHHCWIVDDNVESFDRSYADAPVVDVAPISRDLSSELSSGWRFAPKEPKPVVAICDTAVAVRDALVAACAEGETRKVRIVVNGDVEAVAIQLREAIGIEPAYIAGVHGAVDSFNVTYRAGKARVDARATRAVDAAVRTDDQASPEPAALDALNRVASSLSRCVGAVANRAAMSRYSAGAKLDLGNYHRGPRAGCLDETLLPVDDDRYLCIDQGRAYTGHLAALNKMPVFGLFDDFRPVDETVPVEPLARYLVRCPTRDHILLEKWTDVLFGFSVDYARRAGIPVELLGVMRPHRFAACNVGTELRALYRDKELADEDRKAIGCITYGQAGKRRTQAQRAEVFSTEEEAISHGGDVRPFGAGFLSMRSGTKELDEGFAYAGAFVLERSRIALHRMVAAVKGSGVPCIAVRTDCVYVPLADGDRAKAALREAGFSFATEVRAVASSWDRKVGTLRCEEVAGAFLPRAPLKLDAGEGREPIPVRAAPVCQRAVLPSETRRGWDNAELDAQIPLSTVGIAEAELDAYIDSVVEGREDFYENDCRDERDNVPLALEALVPGAGKSYSIKDHARRHGLGDALLNITSWNRLKCEITSEGFRAVTLHKWLGRGVDDDTDEATARRAMSMAGVRHIHFEEPYLYTVAELEWIAAFMRANPDIAYTMAGDPGQLRPVNQKLSVDPDEYYEAIFAELFPRRLTLQYSKRCASADEGRRMEALCEDLRTDLDTKPAEILARHGLTVVDFEDLTPDDARVPHVAATRNVVARVNAWAHPIHEPDQPEAFLVGQQLLGNGGGAVKGGRINPNEIYTIAAVDDDRLTVTNVDGKRFQPTLAQAAKFLRRPYCATNHAVQGLSLGEKLFIHEFDSRMADHRWVRTAVSRCSTLDITLVRHRAVCGERFDIAARIEGHRRADAAHGFAPAADLGQAPNQASADSDEPGRFVDAAWVATQLERQGGACAQCGELLGEAGTGQWSIDRISNQMGHAADNCRLVCAMAVSPQCQAATAKARN